MSDRATEGHDTRVSIDTRAYNQHGTLVMSYRRQMLVPKRGHAVEDKIDQARAAET